jgi:hypothetical protein
MTKTYVCVICNTLNHSSRLHCQCCGTIPARYSWHCLLSGSTQAFPSNANGIQVVKANGADTTEMHHARRLRLQTVAADYYAEV